MKKEEKEEEEGEKDTAKEKDSKESILSDRKITTITLSFLFNSTDNCLCNATTCLFVDCTPPPSSQLS